MGTEDAVSGSGAGNGMGADFAESLRELKERSGLSYGVLAKRLHMSTSTLHRYCNGDAVPADYAPVERLARLCKATPEELVALHRKWVLADATRGSRKSEAAVGDGAGSGVAEAESQSGAGVGVGPSMSVSASASASVSASTAAADSAGRPVREATVGDEVCGGPQGAPGARRRSRVALVAGLAAAAVLGAVTLAVSLPSDGARDGAGRTTGSAPLGEAGADDRAASPSEALPSASASKQGKKDGKGGKERKDGKGEEGEAGEVGGTGGRTGVGGSASSTPAESGRAGAGGNSSGAAPLTVKVEPYTWESPCDQRYLVPRPPTEVEQPPPEQDAPRWVRAAGAVSSGNQFLTLSVQGSGKETVVVRSLKVRIVDRKEPLPWNDYVMGFPGVGCGAGVPTRSFTIALDGARPEVKPKAGSRDFPYSVSESDPEVYYITADASAYYVRWNLELEWTSGSRSGTLTVNDNGVPLRTSGNNGRPAYEYPLHGPKWVEEGTTLNQD
ncbi:helix-turn-helix domain-containing protein [Streptomyces sp. NPDC012510]|uniref:helix-turn-helix domain-containing protein n=1 Tax=Streptomyces sp. NPDC012510 TaxID=3364838 RepID=UPI0036E60CFA